MRKKTDMKGHKGLTVKSPPNSPHHGKKLMGKSMGGSGGKKPKGRTA